MSIIIDIEFDLLENGLDFIRSSLVPVLKPKDENELKYSLLHISAGTELVLKEILKSEHWSLIFEDIDKANSQDLQSGDFQSVSFDTILLRLQNIAEIDISPKAIIYFKELRKRRNRIEHFAFREKNKAIISIVSKILSHLIEIIKEHVDITEYSDKSQIFYKEILKQSSEFEEFSKLIYSKLKPALDSLGKEKIPIYKCPECFHETLPIDGTNECLFCGYSDPPEDIAYNFIENILEISKYSTLKDGGDYPLKNCPGCDQETLVLMDDSYQCFACGDLWELDELDFCNYCNAVYIIKEPDLGMCGNCREAKSQSYMED